jgi:hypothetical protein
MVFEKLEEQLSRLVHCQVIDFAFPWSVLVELVTLELKWALREDLPFVAVGWFCLLPLRLVADLVGQGFL